MLQLAAQFVRRGIAARVIALRGGGELEAEVSSGLDFLPLGATRAISSIGALATTFRRNPPNAVLATQVHVIRAAVAARALSGLAFRLVARETTTPPTVAGCFRRIAPAGLGRLVYRFADAVVAPSAGVRARLTGAVAKEKLLEIPNPVDVDALRDASLKPFPNHATLPSRFVMGLGGLRREKRFDRLIETFASVATQLPHDLVIAGEGPERMALLESATLNGVRHRVHFIGYLPNPFPVLVRASAFALTSDREGMPNALLQALALNVPVVAVDCHSGPREVLEAGRWGRLVAVNDRRAFAEALLSAVAEPPPTTSSMIRSRFGIDGVVRHYQLALALQTSGPTDLGDA